MRATAAMVVAASVLLIPTAVMAAIVAPFGLDYRVPALRQVLSIVLMLGPILLVVAAVYAFVLMKAHRRMTMVPLVAFAAAAGANALFWLGV